MTVRLTVYRDPWRARAAHVAAACPGMLPVVKGNGYGFGRGLLMTFAAELASRVGVGTIHELDEVPEDITPIVLTPALAPPGRPDAVLTVSAPEHVARLDGWRGRVAIKLESSMRRYGVGPDQLDRLRDTISAAGLELAGYMLHLPTAGTDDERRQEIEGWLAQLPSDASLSVSHLELPVYRELRSRHPSIDWELRLGTALWHGDKTALRLTVDVIDTRHVSAGDRVGYHHTPVSADGTLVMVGGGTAHAIVPLLDGRSPFHFARRRLELVEPPHMHTSLVLVPEGDPVPGVGEAVDLQRPVLATTVDETTWI